MLFPVILNLKDFKIKYNKINVQNFILFKLLFGYAKVEYLFEQNISSKKTKIYLKPNRDEFVKCNK